MRYICTQLALVEQRDAPSVSEVRMSLEAHFEEVEQVAPFVQVHGTEPAAFKNFRYICYEFPNNWCDIST
uniref:Uncharacterized protein n=1 Tax=Arundo donax TaxID=35708 RepID=A0A0A9HJR9_ARUDO